MSGFSDRQTRALQRSVAQRHIRARVSEGKELSYIEGWFVIAEANRIFGFDGWDRETVEAKCIQAREVRGSHSVLYAVRVRITVRAGERSIVRDAHGTGEGRGGHLGEAHDLALKAAETDATKRALVTFGKAFGLALYSDRRRQARQTEEAAAAQGGAPAPSHSNGTGRAIPKAALQPGGAAVRHGTLPAQVDGPGLRARIDKSELVLGEPRRIRDKDHLRYIASQPCVVCGRVPGDAHHIRFAQPKALGAKVSDEFTIPLCRVHHRELHANGNERSWWHDMGIDPLSAAKRLWEDAHGGNWADQHGDKGGGSPRLTIAAEAPAVPEPTPPKQDAVGEGQDRGRD